MQLRPLQNVKVGARAILLFLKACRPWGDNIRGIPQNPNLSYATIVAVVGIENTTTFQKALVPLGSFLFTLTVVILTKIFFPSLNTSSALRLTSLRVGRGGAFWASCAKALPCLTRGEKAKSPWQTLKGSTQRFLQGMQTITPL